MKIVLQNALVEDVIDDRRAEHPSVTIVIDEELQDERKSLLAVRFTKELDRRADIKRGQRIEVTFYVSSREGNSRWFNNINGTFAKVIGATPRRGSNARNQPPPAGGSPDDDIPFAAKDWP